MQGIQKNLLHAFFAVIVSLTITTIALLSLGFYSLQQYKAISDALIAEYRLVDSLSELISAYNERFISTSTNEEQTDRELNQARAEISELTTFLDTAIRNRQSKALYVGLKNSIETVTNTVDKSVSHIAKGDITNFTSDYYEINKQYEFVRDNGTALIFEELKYASSILDTIDLLHAWSQIIGIGLLVAIVGVCVLYVVRFSKKLTAPLSRLEQLALRVAEGALDVKVDADLREKKDELGSLAVSFHTMTTELARANRRIVESQEELKKHAEVLERMNKLMVGRELKMRELKSELNAIKSSPEVS
jgi:HAMP domain-containing protein